MLGPLVSTEGAAALRSYQYKGHDHGLLSSGFYQPWWRFCVELLPLWLAPNVVTLAALLFMAVAYALSLVYTPTLTEVAPSWVYAYYGVAMFAYMTLDAIDGKQARRTSSSSPLGELFDHGCDAINTCFTVVTTVSAMRLGGSPLYFWFCTSIYVSFFLAQWEEYHTHIMEFPLFGVTEGHTLYMLLMLVSAVAGPQLWGWSLRPQLGVDVTVGQVYLSLGMLGALLGGVNSARRVYQCVQRGTVTSFQAVSRLLPVLLLHLPCVAWLIQSATSPLSLQSPLDFPHLFELVRGMITAHAVGNTILARVTSASFPHLPLPAFCWPAIVALFLHNFLPIAPTLAVYLSLTALVYMVFAVRVIGELCEILHIRTFVIPYPSRSKKA